MTESADFQYEYEKLAEKQKQEDKRVRQQFLADLREISKHAAGIRLFDYLLSITGLYLDAFDGSDNGTAYRCGKQAVGKQFLMELAEADPQIYIKILQSRIGENDA